MAGGIKKKIGGQ